MEVCLEDVWQQGYNNPRNGLESQIGSVLLLLFQVFDCVFFQLSHFSGEYMDRLFDVVYHEV